MVVSMVVAVSVVEEVLIFEWSSGLDIPSVESLGLDSPYHLQMLALIGGRASFLHCNGIMGMINIFFHIRRNEITFLQWFLI